MYLFASGGLTPSRLRTYSDTGRALRDIHVACAPDRAESCLVPWGYSDPPETGTRLHLGPSAYSAVRAARTLAAAPGLPQGRDGRSALDSSASSGTRVDVHPDFRERIGRLAPASLPSEVRVNDPSGSRR